MGGAAARHIASLGNDFLLHLSYDYIYPGGEPALLLRPRAGRKQARMRHVPACPAIFFLDPNFPFDLVTRIFYYLVFSTAVRTQSLDRPADKSRRIGRMRLGVRAGSTSPLAVRPRLHLVAAHFSGPADMTSPANERRTKRYAEDEEFRASTRAYNRAWYKANKDRVNAESRRKRAENPDWKAKQRDRRRRTKRKDMLKYCYGMTVAEYEAMLAQQNGVCAICETKPDDRPLCVDHDHATGKVRGLLCHSCNVGLGNYKDDPRRTRRTTAYLEAWLGIDPAWETDRDRAES
jgi:Recombination endonuclease VII